MFKKTFSSIALTILLGLSVPANANVLGNSVGADKSPTVNKSILSTGSDVKIRAGTVRAGTRVNPIYGFTRAQCIISVSGVPTKNDGAYKRGRNYSLWSSPSGAGWILYAGTRFAQSNSLIYTSNTYIQYQMTCVK